MTSADLTLSAADGDAALVEVTRDPARVAYSPAEAATAAGLGVSTVRVAARDGGLRAYRVGARIVILREDLVEWIRSSPAAASP